MRMSEYLDAEEEKRFCKNDVCARHSRHSLQWQETSHLDLILAAQLLMTRSVDTYYSQNEDPEDVADGYAFASNYPYIPAWQIIDSEEIE